MTAALPKEEIAEIIAHWHHGGHISACDMNAADGISARLRPAFEELDTLRVWRRDAEHTIFEAGKMAGGLAKERDTLRADLARKDEALRACGEALRKLSRRHKDLCSGGEECRLHDEADAALARAQEEAK